ncbi:lipocalin family protein [Parabacteroides sp. ASD2025]
MSRRGMGTASFSDTWTIEKLTSDSLIICQGDYVQRYARVNDVKT